MAARGNDPETFLVVDGPLGAGGTDRPSVEVSVRNKDTVPATEGRTLRAGKGESLGPKPSGVSLLCVVIGGHSPVVGTASRSRFSVCECVEY